MTGITLDLPTPPPINKVRRINWAAHPKHLAWRKRAGNAVLEFISLARKRKAPTHIPGQYEIIITVDESNKIDLDSVIKSSIDFCVVSGLVTDDSKPYLRRVVAEWGQTSEGMRVTVRPITE